MSWTLGNKEKKTQTSRFLERFFGGKSSLQKCDVNTSRTASSMKSSADATSSSRDEGAEATRRTTGCRASTSVCAESQASASKPASSVGSRQKAPQRRGVRRAVENDPASAVDYPATPETILARHCACPFLDAEELAALEELNEFECLVDGVDVIHAAAQHVRYFDVDPARMWDEFFRYVDDVVGRNQVISAELWREFTDSKYPTC